MPNKHYSSKPTSLRYHLMAKRCLKVGRKSKFWTKSEARNLPTWGCKSMMEGPTIMLGVFITLLYMYTMPNKHYSSKPTSLRYHLMAKRCLKVGRKSGSEARNLPTWGGSFEIYLEQGLAVLETKIIHSAFPHVSGLLSYFIRIPIRA